MLGKIDILIVIGQSLGFGTNSTPVLSSSHFYQGMALNGNPKETSGVFRSLMETGVESPASGAVSFFNELSVDSQNCIVINSCSPGAAYSDIAKGSSNWYNVFIPQLKRVAMLNKAKIGNVFVSCIHGETDALEPATRASYKINLLQWQKDIEKAVNEELSIDGYQKVPFLCCQMSSHAWYAGRTANYPNAINQPTTALAILELAKESPSLFKLVTPKYIFENCAVDGVHLSNSGSRSLGYYHGRVMAAIANSGEWKSFLPIEAIKLNPSKYRIYFDAPVLPLRFDTTLVNPVPGQGFRFSDSNGNIGIALAALSGSNSVDLSLANASTGSNKAIDYAWTTTLGNDSNPQSGSRGHLRDSDVSSPYWLPQGSMPNWCPHFKIQIPS
jgi:hypothetical protein